MVAFFVERYGDKRCLHVMKHSVPTRRASDWGGVGGGNVFGIRPAPRTGPPLTPPASGRGTYSVRTPHIFAVVHMHDDLRAAGDVRRHHHAHAKIGRAHV